MQVILPTSSLEQSLGEVCQRYLTDVEIFYLMHRERFHRPEFRQLKYILLTINDNLPGSDRATTRARVDAIRARLIKSPERFAEQAPKHFEGPTAMNGGLLGATKRG